MDWEHMITPALCMKFKLGHYLVDMLEWSSLVVVIYQSIKTHNHNIYVRVYK